MPAVTLQTFGGLNLAGDAQDAQGAIDALNVDFDSSGRVRTRDGYTQVSAGSSDLGTTAMVQQGVGGNFVINAGIGDRARAYNSAGTLLASSAVLARDNYGLVNFGSPTASYVYAPTGNVVNTIARWDGAAWSYPASGYSATHIGVTPWDNRLILAAENSPTLDNSRVRFSDAGLPETFTANSYVDLLPGDNEEITGIRAWRDKVFVFKQTKFFVFYGTSADSTGQPVFNYRTVATGQGAIGFISVVAMDDAVYFSNTSGLFRTTGGPPEKVSGPVDPLFSIGTANYFASSCDTTRIVNLSRFGRKVLLNAPGASTPFSLVFDTEHNAWSYWNIAVSAGVEYKLSSVTVPVFLFTAVDGKIHKMGSAYTTDNGTAIPSRYRTGFYDGQIPEQEKWLRSMMLSGTGTVNVKTAVNDAVTLSSAVSVAMGTSPAVGTGRWGAGTRGRNISVDVSATSGQWSLSHLSMDIAATRPAGVRAA